MRNYLPNPPAGTQRISVIKWVGRESSTSKEIMNERTSLTSSAVVNEVNNENKYTCSFCEKPFKWRSHWKSHERIHTGERPYQCQICGKRFTRSDGLQCHGTIHGTMLDSYSLTYQHRPTTYMLPHRTWENFMNWLCSYRYRNAVCAIKYVIVLLDWWNTCENIKVRI